MEDDLPSEYDVIVIGTGMAESIVAAAASRIGKKVLHLDRNDYYGGMWASFNFDALQKWLEECRKPASKTESPTVDKALVKEGETLILSGNQFSTVGNIDEKWLIPEESAKETEESQPEAEENKWNQSKIKSLSRKFNLDLAPKLLFSRGSLVDLLISSNIARYAEFRSVTRILTWFHDNLEAVPCSRADVFAAKDVSVIEKRLLMQLLQLCVEYKPDGNEFEGFKDKTFIEYLKSKNLTENILHYVLYAIAMSSEKTPCMTSVERAQRFLSSLGRYGNTPFLWPMYGSGELPQCFCRLCAVFGGVYHLKRAADGIIVTGEGSSSVCKGIISDGQRLTTDHLVLDVPDAPPSFLQKTPTGGLSRGVFITNKSILPSEKESLTLLQFPPGDGKEPITIIEVGPTTHACPSGLYIVHMTCKQYENAVEDLKPAVEKLLKVEKSNGDFSKASEEDKEKTENRPQVLWTLYFNCPETSECDLSANVPKNVYLTSGPDLDIDFEFAVKQAKEIFTKMYPDAEFLPRAPDPEEIILDGDEETGPKFETSEEGKGDAAKTEEE
ncbi:rab proteins geranylgeranyltransferase component A 1 [Planococcus citri]|uniref:rab proteins geranylgeranyltransferase component A 1 n=1 Tax=Planococcus citri TaxID=170843 RepID=UPI0031F89052